MKIAYLCQYFLPEIGAPSARVSELSSAWVELGHEVTVITGLPNHPTGLVPPKYRRVIFRKERLDGIEVWRNWLYATPNEGFIKKTLSHVSFMLSSALLSTPRLQGFDVLIVSSPTFFCVLTAWFMSNMRRVPFVFEVRDLWPGIFVELGVLKNRLVIRLLECVEMFLYRSASRVVVVTESFANNLRNRGVPDAKIMTITNGVDANFFTPCASENSVRRDHGLNGKFIVLYIGAHGISHALGRILDAAELTADDSEICWVFVGEGAEKAHLIARAREKGLSNVRFIPGQPRILMPAWYAACDVALVPLRNIPLFEAFIPSKMFEIMACGRPIIGSVQGEARRILDASGGAVTVEPEDANGIAAAVRCLKSQESLRRKMGESGRNFVMAHFRRQDLARDYATLLETVAREAAFGKS
jgi:glycosyltransferase involved in cell wall biosynthesis